MRGILTGLGVLSSLASAIEATQHDGIISYPLKATTARNISKRQIEIGVENGLDGVLYTIDISVGTPGQTVAVQVDTGSEELWVNPECASSIDPAFCQSTGRFTQSTTLVDLITRGGKQYPLGNAEWEYGLDYVGVGSALLEGQIFGVADDTSGLPAGVLGLAPALSGWNSPYPLVLDNMAAQGYISSRAFSLDLRHAGAQDGVVIFGGIDTARYIGPLERLPIIPANQSPDGFTRYWVSASSIAVSRQGKNDVIVSGTARAFTLDTSYSLTGLPSPLFEAFIQAFPTAAPASGTNQYTVDCYALQVIGAIRFTFGNTVISIPYRDFISQKGNTCYLDVIRSDSLPVLGINFLRAAYVVFDLDNREILMANSAINDCGSNLVRIGSGPGAVPSIVGTCAGTSSFTTPISTSTSTPTSTGASTSARVIFVHIGVIRFSKRNHTGTYKYLYLHL
ncbi:aspartic peptidase domain-containing protein [Stachybotrys elegans]|uniref:Aspartic peptidase domain-containing protein n=1 Tax=Stachybotrys elegans TaxID=80388 RepID=A0A8K0WVC1_9HYPO|nr:aspartic peptidase domain-containing protein [Stachybotrys elegans]